MRVHFRIFVRVLRHGASQLRRENDRKDIKEEQGGGAGRRGKGEEGRGKGGGGRTWRRGRGREGETGRGGAALNQARGVWGIVRVWLLVRDGLIVRV